MWKVYASIPNHTYPETIHIKNYFAPDSSLVDSISFDVGDTIEIYTSGLETRHNKPGANNNSTKATPYPAAGHWPRGLVQKNASQNQGKLSSAK